MNEFNLNKNIAALRKAAGMTQESLANMLGLSYQAVSKWENGISCPDVQLLPTLAEIFGVSIDALFGMEAPKDTAENVANTELPWADDEGIYVVIYRGHRLVTEDPYILDSGLEKIPLVIKGNPKNVTSVLSVHVDGNIVGDISAGGSINCDNIEGSAAAGCNINCDDIWGNASAGGRINCDTVKGSVFASNVTCDEGCIIEDANGVHGHFNIEFDDMSPEQRKKINNIVKNSDRIEESAVNLADRIVGRISKTLDNIFK